MPVRTVQVGCVGIAVGCVGTGHCACTSEQKKKKNNIRIKYNLKGKNKSIFLIDNVKLKGFLPPLNVDLLFALYTNYCSVVLSTALLQVIVPLNSLQRNKLQS
jgi:hypothetical protein